MKVSFGALVITAGFCGILSFAFLATSLGTDYWYIIEVNPMNMCDLDNTSSHWGLWSINEGDRTFVLMIKISPTHVTNVNVTWLFVRFFNLRFKY